MVDRTLRKRSISVWFTYTVAPDGQLTFQVDDAALARERRTDGICLLVTNAPTLSAAEVARGYRTLWEVEQAFREMKSFLRIRPVYHYADLRVRGHVFVCVLAYLLETVLEQKLQKAGLPLNARKALHLLKPIHLVQAVLQGNRLGKRTAITPEQENIYRALGIIEVPKTPVLAD